jgi:dolichyl-phosphate-mannose--protein O-mannosyl transferase
MRPNSMVQFVHAMGNPLLYWLSAIAILIWLAFLISSKLRFPPEILTQMLPKERSQLFWFASYVTISFAGHWLPWSLSKRCIFLYHYMPASVFAFAALALLVSVMWRSPLQEIRTLGSGIVGIIAIAFIFWLPIYIGLPISSGYLPVLMWLPSWI